ncbi:MAG: hypothetical protein ACREE5_15000 [Acetobacteraceae bacterium]
MLPGFLYHHTLAAMVAVPLVRRVRAVPVIWAVRSHLAPTPGRTGGDCRAEWHLHDTFRPIETDMIACDTSVLDA